MAASAAQTKKMVVICTMLAILFIGVATAECVSGIHGVPVDPAGCICSKNCACAGKCILEGVEDPKTCFVDCVLKNDCICPIP